VVSIHRRISRSRLTAALLATSATVLVVGTPLATASAATSPVQNGLFGAQDPTYDGVFRQSLAVLAYRAAGQTPPADAVTWLVGQQCADGGFQAFRSRTTTACQKSDPATYTGEDTNSTGIAAAALRAIGQAAAADRALAWTLAAQNSDGGFPYYLGGASDANSTSVVLLGSNSAGRTPDSVQTGGISAVHYLTSLQVGCAGAPTDDDGGFAFQDYGSGLLDNDAASVQATLALSGAALPFTPRTVSTGVPRSDCTTSPAPTPPATPAQLGAGHLARVLDAYSGAVPRFDFTAGARVPGSVSAGDTAWAALALAAVGVGRTQLDAALGVLSAQKMTAANVRTGAPSVSAAAVVATDQPGQLALAALATAAAGGSASTVDGYVARIGATIRIAPAATSPSPSPTPSTTSPATTSSPPTPSASSSSSDSGALSPTGATPLTPVIALLGAALLLLGSALLTATRSRGGHA